MHFATGTLPTRVIAAWGDEDAISFHGAYFAKAEVILFSDAASTKIDPILEIAAGDTATFFDVVVVSSTSCLRATRHDHMNFGRMGRRWSSGSRSITPTLHVISSLSFDEETCRKRESNGILNGRRGCRSLSMAILYLPTFVRRKRGRAA